MNLRAKLDRLERKHEELNPCPRCAYNAGIRVATVEGEEPFDLSTLDCPECGAPCKYPMLVRFIDDPVEPAEVDA